MGGQSGQCSGHPRVHLQDIAVGRRISCLLGLLSRPWFCVLGAICKLAEVVVAVAVLVLLGDPLPLYACGSYGGCDDCQDAFFTERDRAAELRFHATGYTAKEGDGRNFNRTASTRIRIRLRTEIDREEALRNR